MKNIDTDSLDTLLSYAHGRNLRIGSHEHMDDDGTYWVPNSGHSGPNDPHYTGNAIDVGMRGRDIPTEIAAAKAAGFKVLDETYTGNGPYGPSTGPHLHLEYYGGSPSPPNSSLTLLQQQVVDTANKYGIPPEKLLGVIQRESSFNPNAVSTTKTGRKDIGLGQLSPAVAAQYGVTDRTDPQQNMDGTAQYLSNLYKQYGDWDTATAHYIGYGSANAYRGSKDYTKQNGYEQQWLGKLGSPTAGTQVATDAGLDSLQKILGGSSSVSTPSPQTKDVGLSSLQSILGGSPTTTPSSVSPQTDTGLLSLQQILNQPTS